MADKTASAREPETAVLCRLNEEREKEHISLELHGCTAFSFDGVWTRRAESSRSANRDGTTFESERLALTGRGKEEGMGGHGRIYERGKAKGERDVFPKS